MRIIVFKSKPKTNQGSHRTSNTMSKFPLTHFDASHNAREYLKYKAKEAGYIIPKFQKEIDPEFDEENYFIYKRMAQVISRCRRNFSTTPEMLSQIMENYDHRWFKITEKKRGGVKEKKNRTKWTQERMERFGDIGTRKVVSWAHSLSADEKKLYHRMMSALKRIDAGSTCLEEYDDDWRKTHQYKSDADDLPPPPLWMLSDAETSGSETDEYTKSILPDLDTLILPPPPADFWDN